MRANNSGKLYGYKGQSVVVYALPRGGVVLGAEVARALDAPLDLIVVRKIGHPDSPEYAIGAVAEDGYVLTNPAEAASLDERWIEGAAAAELKEARRRRDLYVRGRSPVAAAETVNRLRGEVDRLVVLYIPSGFFGAVGAFYRRFDQVSDEEVVPLMSGSECKANEEYR